MIRVLIERRLASSIQEPLQAAMRNLRGAAIHHPGYVSGETLRDAADPQRYVIISTWRSPADWEAWVASAERRKIDEQIAPLLVEPETVTILEPA